jgi:hypothetical protein
MGSKGFLMRMLPFFATFAVGIFIASFFVNIGGPGFRGRGNRFHEMQRLRVENEQQRNEILRLRTELESEWGNCGDSHRMFHDEWMNRGPEFPVETPPAPPMPVSPRTR